MPPGDWVFLGAGSYNKAYRSRDGEEVLKIQKTSDATDAPERSVRLWNAINAHIPPPARLANTEFGSGWVCPFVQGVQASDKEMATALIDIFNNTGRVVVDATAAKNFIRTPTGQVLCVDVGMMLQLERRNDPGFAPLRRQSIVSLNMWRDTKSNYEPFLKTCAFTNPDTVNTVKALVFIKDNRPDIYDVNFLKTNPELVRKLAQAYDKQNVAGAIAHLDTAFRPATYAIPWDKIHQEVQSFVSYLRSRGSSFVISDHQVRNMSLSATYENPGDSNKPYTNIVINHPEVETLFKDYVADRARLAAERLAAINDYQAKLEIIDLFRKQAVAEVV